MPPVPQPTPKLLLVEGIPGSGKSSLAVFVRDWLAARGLPCRLYPEGDLDHPADFESVAYFTPAEFAGLCARHPDWTVQLQAALVRRGADHFISYRRLAAADGSPPPADLFHALAAHDVYELASAETYMRLLRQRWQDFAAQAAQADQITIFECCAVQNPLAMLLARLDQPLADIRAHIEAVLASVRSLNPALVYLYQLETLPAFERIASRRPPEWREFVLAYIEQGAWAQRCAVRGVASLVAYHDLRRQFEFELLASLGFPNLLIDTSGEDWGRAQAALADFLSRLYPASVTRPE